VGPLMVTVDAWVPDREVWRLGTLKELGQQVFKYEDSQRPEGSESTSTIDHGGHMTTDAVVQRLDTLEELRVWTVQNSQSQSPGVDHGHWLTRRCRPLMCCL
jgi:hypothetical protein